jgi:formamidopyrimidine-DNA glycosylase
MTLEKAIEFGKIFLKTIADEKGSAIYEFVETAVKMMEQEAKTGHWIKVSDGYGDNAYICECSECKDTVWVYKDADRKWNYCPNCGCRMKGVE